MNQDIIKMAREAGVIPTKIDGLERFFHMAQADMKEKCAKEFDGRLGGDLQSKDWWEGFKTAKRQYAAAIRAIGDSP